MALSNFIIKMLLSSYLFWAMAGSPLLSTSLHNILKRQQVKYSFEKEDTDYSDDEDDGVDDHDDGGDDRDDHDKAHSDKLAGR